MSYNTTFYSQLNNIFYSLFIIILFMWFLFQLEKYVRAKIHIQQQENEIRNLKKLVILFILKTSRFYSRQRSFLFYSVHGTTPPLKPISWSHCQLIWRAPPPPPPMVKISLQEPRKVHFQMFKIVSWNSRHYTLIKMLEATQIKSNHNNFFSNNNFNVLYRK